MPTFLLCSAVAIVFLLIGWGMGRKAGYIDGYKEGYTDSEGGFDYDDLN